MGLQVPDDAVLLSRTGCMQKRIEASGMEDDGEPVLQSVPLVCFSHETVHASVQRVRPCLTQVLMDPLLLDVVSA